MPQSLTMETTWGLGLGNQSPGESPVDIRIPHVKLLCDCGIIVNNLTCTTHIVE
jgi:hypothetical protein